MHMPFHILQTKQHEGLRDGLKFFGLTEEVLPSQRLRFYIGCINQHFFLSSRGESGWCLDWTSTPGAWRHAGAQFPLPGALFALARACVFLSLLHILSAMPSRLDTVDFQYRWEYQMFLIYALFSGMGAHELRAEGAL